jgi:hypothetical protein
MNAPLAQPINGHKLPDLQTVFAERCEARAILVFNGQLSLHQAVDELQNDAESSGLIDLIGQDAVQDIMGTAFAVADMLPDELAEACEAEIMLAAANLVRQWELADSRDRWKHTGEAPPQLPRSPRCAPGTTGPYKPADSTVAAFWYVAAHEPDKLKAWLARHPTDAPALHRIWKAKRCS